MKHRIRVVIQPDPFGQSVAWILVGGDTRSDGATAYYLGPDRDPDDGSDLAARKIPSMACRAAAAGMDVTEEELGTALEAYRRTWSVLS